MNAMIGTAPARPLLGSLWPLIRFDLRRFRMLVLLMLALELARAGLVEWSVHLLPTDMGRGIARTLGGLEMSLVDAVLGLATGVTTAIVAQADLPSDDRAFWRTRPIPAIALALAKLLAFALLFVAVPSAINAGRLLAYGAPVSAIGAASVQIAVLAGATVVPAWILALVTRTLPRFLGTAAGLLVGGNMLWAAILYWTDLWYGAARSARAG